MKIMNLVSGSSGNSTLVGTDQTMILCDAGVSMKKIEECLNTADHTMKDIDAIFVTHEHSDHIRGLGVISRKWHIPVYATQETIDAIFEERFIGRLDTELFIPLEPEENVVIRDLHIKAHSVLHDAADPVCYSFSDDHSRACIATDMGCYTNKLIRSLSGCDYMLIETNHDIRMLEAGSYPYDLKQRILGDYGHLSNEAGGALIRELLNEHVKEIRLGHLSKENNFPELALMTVRQELLGNPYAPDPDDLPIYVAERDAADVSVEI